MFGFNQQNSFVDPMEQHRKQMEAHNRLIQQQHPQVWNHMHGQAPPHQNQLAYFPNPQNQSAYFPNQQNFQQQNFQQNTQGGVGNTQFSSSSSHSSLDENGQPIFYSKSTIAKAVDGTKELLSIEHNSQTGETKKVAKRAMGNQTVEEVEVSDGNTANRSQNIQNMDPHDRYLFEQKWDKNAAKLNEGGSAYAVSSNSTPNGLRIIGVVAPQQVRIEEDDGGNDKLSNVSATKIDEPE